MRALALLLALAPVSGLAAEAVKCLSIDGQVRADFSGSVLTGVTLRAPAEGAREARTARLFPSDVVLEILSESAEQVTTEGCAGAASGAIAVLVKTTRTTRRIRLSLPGGGAFPAGIAGRTAGGEALVRDLTCTQSRQQMAQCP